VQNCRFLNNVAEDAGGGLYAEITQFNETAISVLDCVFEGNRTTASGSVGGGAYLTAGSVAGVTVSGCQFIGNSTEQGGGGLKIEGLPIPEIVTSVAAPNSPTTSSTATRRNSSPPPRAAAQTSPPTRSASSRASSTTTRAPRVEARTCARS